MDEQTGEVVKEALKTCWLIICFSIESHRGQKQPRNVVFAQAQQTDGRTDGRTNRPTDGRTDGRTDGQTLLERCEYASKKERERTLREEN